MYGMGVNRSDMHENEIGRVIVDASLRLHQALGPGLLESVYETLLAHALESRGLSVERQVSVPIVFLGKVFDQGFRADLVVEQRVILELKSVEATKTVHMKQVLTYLKLSGMKLGYVLNFGAPIMKEGITRVINGCLD